MKPSSKNIGFVSTRFAGTDGVSLETEKWAETLTTFGYECFYFAGECDRPTERSMVLPEAHFNHPDILCLSRELFDDYQRSSENTGLIQALRFHIKQHLYQFIDTFEIGMLVVENALSLPLNIPLGLALTELIAETQIPTIAHHHDFAWERSRFALSGAEDYLRAAFPPTLRSISHVVINSFAARQMALRTGASARLIPNVMDFDHPPDPPDEYGRGLRQSLGIQPGQRLFLQPTRIVPRKRIELAIELVHRLDPEGVLVITHESGDEGSAYLRRLREYAEILKVDVLFGSEIVNHNRGVTEDSQMVYSLSDAYLQADLVTYPSTVEGFGNAFLETIYHKRQLVMSTYEIFKTDIQPKGFRVIGFEDFIQEDTVEEAKKVLEDPELCDEMTAHNYELGCRYYSYETLRNSLSMLLRNRTGPL